MVEPYDLGPGIRRDERNKEKLAAVTIAGFVALSALPAHAASRYVDCLAAPEPAPCIAAKGLEGMGGAPWTDRLGVLGRAGARARAREWAGSARRMASILMDQHRRPAEAALAALETVDPAGAAMARPGAANDQTWLRFTAVRSGELMSRPLPAE